MEAAAPIASDVQVDVTSDYGSATRDREAVQNALRSHRSAFNATDEERRHNARIVRQTSVMSEPATANASGVAVSQLNQMRAGVSQGLDGYWSSLNYLLIFVPFSIIQAIFFHNATITFVTSFIGMIPLAMILGKATEDIAEHTNETLGALVNVTFGNAVELILSVSALMAGKMALIRDTIAGSILSNLLLVLGSAFFFGGLRYHEQVVLPAVSEANADLLSFSVFGLSIPALYAASGVYAEGSDQVVSLLTSIGLLLIYAMYIFFQLYTHAEDFNDGGEDDVIESRLERGQTISTATTSTSADTSMTPGAATEEDQLIQQQSSHQSSSPDQTHDGSGSGPASLPVAIAILLSMVVLVSISSEFLVGSIDEFSAVVGLNERFIAVVLLPVVGNAVEHMSAILVARHNKIDLSIGIACGSSVQVALFAAPLLVVVSWFIGPAHLTLNFDMFAILCIGFSVFIVISTMRDSRTNWLEGAVLIVCYFIISSAFYMMS